MVDQETGIILIVLGVVVTVLGFFFVPLCAVGVLLLIVGIVVALVGQPRPVFYAAPPGTYPYPAPPAPPACPVCGAPLTWVPQYGRWFCASCQQYR